MKKLAILLAQLLMIVLVIGAVGSDGEVAPTPTPTPTPSPSDQTATGNMTTHATIDCISVEATYTGDDNSSNSATLQYRVHGNGTWLDALPMAGEYGHLIWAGSVIGLAGNTTYDLQVAFSDSDGVNGPNPVMGNATTRQDTYSLGAGTTYYVKPTGSDSLSGTSVANAWKTIQHAASTLTAGANVYILPGTYYEAITIFRNSGTSYRNMITFIAFDPNNKPVISGANATIEANAARNIWMAVGDGSYYTSYSTALPYYVAANDTRLWQYANSIEWGKRGTGDYAGISGGYYWNSGTNGLYIQLPDNSNPNNSTLYSPIHVDDHSGSYGEYDSAFLLYGCDYIQIRNIEMKYYSFGVAVMRDDNTSLKRSSFGIVDGCYIHHVNIGVYMFAPETSVKAPTVDWLIQNSTFYDNGPSTWPWNAVKGITYRYGEGDSVQLWYNGQGTVIRHNTSNGMFDGTASGDWSDGWAYGDRNYIRDIDIYDNTYHNCGDDGLTLTGTNINTRIWGNTIYDSFTGISSRPVVLGPCYIFRNVIYGLNSEMTGDTHCVAFKLGGNGSGTNGRIYYYHNTVYDAADSGMNVSAWYNSEYRSLTDDVVAYNNAIVLNNSLIINHPIAAGVRTDYNNLYTTKASDIIRWCSTSYNTWVAFRSGEGQEIHGLNNSGTNCKFVDPANGNFFLQAYSPLIDAGVVISGLDDANSLYAYEGSASDTGAYEYEEPTPTLTPASTSSRAPTTPVAPPIPMPKAPLDAWRIVGVAVLGILALLLLVILAYVVRKRSARWQ